MREGAEEGRTSTAWPRSAGAIHKSDRAGRAARRMRRAPTLTEDRLWKILRKLESLHFRRQAPFGPYIIDFVCHRSRLIVEVDGGIHDLEAVAERDARRDAWLKARGYRVLRISDQAVAHDLASVVALILADIAETPPPPTPSPQGGGGF